MSRAAVQWGVVDVCSWCDLQHPACLVNIPARRLWHVSTQINLTCGTTTAKCWSNRLNVQWRDVDNRHGDLIAAFSRISERAESLPGCAGHGITIVAPPVKPVWAMASPSAVRGYPSPRSTAPPVTVRPTFPIRLDRFLSDISLCLFALWSPDMPIAPDKLPNFVTYAATEPNETTQAPNKAETALF